MLGPDAEPDRPADVGAELGACGHDLLGQCERLVAETADEPAVVPLEAGLDEIHRGAADEARDEEVRRASVQLLRGGDLLQDALAKHGDTVAHRHCLDLVVGDVDRRGVDLPLDAGDLRAHLDSELRVEIRERLVHQERLRVADDRSAHRHPLPLAARELARLLVEQLHDPEHAGDLLDAPPDLARRRLAQLQPEADVAVDAHVRIERVVLEDHRQVALARLERVDDLVADPDRPLADRLEPGHHPQRGRLAAARRTDEHHELAVRDLEVEVGERPRPVLVDLACVLERDPGHQRTAPAVIPRTM